MRAWLVVLALGVAAAADAQTVLRNPDGSQTGTSASPIRTDPTGATTQPVSGTVTANAGTNLNTSLLVLDATVTGRFPAGASPANGESNTNTALSRVGAFSFIFNGTTWDRWTGAVTQSGTWTVQPGNTANTTPWLFQIRDAAGNARGANVTASNALVVDGSAVTQPVSGTVTVQQGTGTNLHMVCDSGCTSSAGFADNAAFTFGTTTVNPIAGVLDDTATNTATENSAAIARITAQKALHINLRNNAGTEIGTAATPVQVSLANTAANATAVKVDGSAVTQPVSGTVTANAGTNLNTSLLALESGGNLAKLPVAQGSTTSGQSGPLAQGAVTTNAPTYTTAQTSPLSLDTAGLLRASLKDTPSNTNNLNVNLAASAATVTVSGTVTANAGTNLNTSLLQLDATGVKLNTAQGAAIASVTGPLGQTSTTTAAPTYTTATVNPLNTTTGGALRSDLTTIAGTAPSTAGKIDVKGADGDVFVRQATAANLNATVVGTGTFAVQATDNLTQVAGQTALQGDQNNVASATGALTVGAIGRYNATQPTLTDTRYNFLQLSSRGGLFVATGADAFHVTCDSGCTPGGSFADNAAFTFGTTAVNNTGYVVDDTSTNAVAENSAGSARMTPLRVPYTDLSKDTSALIALLNAVAKTNGIGDTAVSGAKPGYYVRAGLAGNVVSPQNPLPVILPDAPDPCSKRKGNVAISQTATTRLVLGRAGYLIAICYARVVNATAEVVNELEGTGTNCGTGTLAVSGSTTAANGESLAANGGFSAGMGMGTVSTTSVPGNDYCLGQSASARVSGHMTYVYYAP